MSEISTDNTLLLTQNGHHGPLELCDDRYSLKYNCQNESIMVVQVAQLESENSQLMKETRDLERELERRSRMHEGAVLRMRDMQREHSAHVEVLTARIGSLGRQLKHCANEVTIRIL